VRFFLGLALGLTAAVAAPAVGDTFQDTGDANDTDFARFTRGDTGASGGPWSVSEGRILTPAGEPLRCRGLNWYGFETETHAAHGPWTGRSYEALMDDVAAQGFDCLRVPVSPESIQGDAPAAEWAWTWGMTGPEVLRTFLELAEERDLTVFLSFHTYDDALQGGALPGRPWGPTPDGRAYTPDDWTADLTALAELTEGLSNVAMIGLANEPYAMSWAEWEAASLQGARAVARGNPDLLVGVAGVGGDASDAGGYEVNWGANLSKADPERFREFQDRLVFETHVYPPGAHRLRHHGRVKQEDVWRAQWGHLAEAGYAVMIGEVGGAWSSREDREWARELGRYTAWAGVENIFAWCLNPHSNWGEGLLMSNDTWRGWHEHKLAALEPILPD